MQKQFYKIGDVAKQFGVSHSALRTWANEGKIKTSRTPGGQRLFDISSINTFDIAKATPAQERSVVLYSRVSSAKQKDDLLRQQMYLKDNLPDQYAGSKLQEVHDIGSGLNFKRPGLLRILGLVKEGLVSTVVVASRDRLARFGYDLIEWMLTEFGARLLVLDTDDGAPEEELGKDLMSIVQVYCCRWNGKRRYAYRKNENPQAEDSTFQTAEGTSGTDGGMLPVHLQQGSRGKAEAREHPQNGVCIEIVNEFMDKVGTLLCWDLDNDMYCHNEDMYDDDSSSESSLSDEDRPEVIQARKKRKLYGIIREFIYRFSKEQKRQARAAIREAEGPTQSLQSA